MKKKKSDYILTPLGFLSAYSSEDLYEKLMLFMYSNGYNAIILENGELFFGGVRKDDKNTGNKTNK